MARLPPLSIFVLLVAALSGCRALGQVAAGAGTVAVGVGKVAAVAAKTVGPAVAVAAKTASVAAKVAAPVARAAAPVARATGSVARTAAPMARDMGRAAQQVSMDAAKLGVGVAREVPGNDFDYGYGDYEATWYEESVLLPPPPLTFSSVPPTAPSFFELVRIYVDSLQVCFDGYSTSAWASVFFRVDRSGEILSVEIVGGNAAPDSQTCIMTLTSQLRFPADSETHGLLVRATHR